MGSSPDDGRPEMSAFTLESELLLDLVNETRALRSDVVAAAGAKPGKIHYRKGPMSAIERVRLRLREEEHNNLVARLTPRDAEGRRVAPTRADPIEDPDRIARDTLLT